MRADRLLSMMLLLHARKRMTAQELAERLEVSERTIYRDIDALSAAGIPIYTQSGTNGGVFLDEHYRISLTGLSRAQALSLFVSSDAGPLGDLGLADAVENTLLKLFAALPAMHRQEVERLRQRIYIDPANWFQLVEPQPFFELLQQAVWDDHQLKIYYQTVEHGDVEQIIDAYALVAKANIWYLVGRKPSHDMRNYRISRFHSIELLDTHFERDPHFDVAAYWKASCEAFETRSALKFPPYTVTLRVHTHALWFFPGYMEGRYRPLSAPDERGWATYQVVFMSLDDARMRLLGLGTGVEVLEPVELRADVRATAEAIVDVYAKKENVV
jgi:predicted DNA-binding transcriptional regulator YafY